MSKPEFKIGDRFSRRRLNFVIEDFKIEEDGCHMYFIQCQSDPSFKGWVNAWVLKRETNICTHS